MVQGKVILLNTVNFNTVEVSKNDLPYLQKLIFALFSYIWLPDEVQIFPALDQNDIQCTYSVIKVHRLACW